MNIKENLIPAYQRLSTTLTRTLSVVDPERPTAAILLAPNYGNVGDLAISHAQETFLQSLLPEYAVTSISIKDTYRVLRHIKRNWRPGDIVLTVGGGNMGNLYPRAQRDREFIATYLRKVPIISFPQSIIFSSDQARNHSGKREARKIGSNANFILTARESVSRGIMREMFANQVISAPDIVLSLTETTRALPAVPRSGCLIALRSDSERRRPPERDAELVRTINTLGYEINYRDTIVANAGVTSESANAIVHDLIETFRRSELVVTDRLHGMIFAAISGTPCLVIPNSNHKVSGTYSDWIEKSCPYIQLIHDPNESELRAAIDHVSDSRSRASYAGLSFDYSELSAAIIKATGTGK